MMTKAPRKEEERREPKAERRKTRSGLWDGRSVGTGSYGQTEVQAGSQQHSPVQTHFFTNDPVRRKTAGTK